MQILYSYLKYTDILLDVLLLSLALTLSELQENPRRKDTELQEKVHRRVCVRAITFLVTRPPSYAIFSLFCLLSPFCQLRFYIEKIFFGPRNGAPYPPGSPILTIIAITAKCCNFI